jgi:hypothetical protein
MRGGEWSPGCVYIGVPLPSAKWRRGEIPPVVGGGGVDGLTMADGRFTGGGNRGGRAEEIGRQAGTPPAPLLYR